LLFIFFTPQKKKKRKRLGFVFRIRLTYIVPALLPLVAQSGGIGFFVLDTRKVGLNAVLAEYLKT
jgi:hypothetical protein